MSDQELSEKDSEALAAAHEAGVGHSRWSNGPGDIVIIWRDGKPVKPDTET